MAPHLRDEIRNAVRENVSWIPGQDKLPSTSGTQLEPTSRSTTDRDRTSSASSTARTLSFEEFYRKREDERRDGFNPPRKKVKKSNSTAAVAKKLKNVDIWTKIERRSEDFLLPHSKHLEQPWQYFQNPKSDLFF